MSTSTSNDLRSYTGTKSSAVTPVSIYLAGVGTVGSEVLRQIDAVAGPPPSRLRIVGACTSCRALWNPSGLHPRTVLHDVRDGTPLDWSRLVERLKGELSRPLIFIDTTSSLEVASRYEDLFRSGIHVVTPSKHANTQSQSRFERLQAAARERGVYYRYEATVGAGLPVVRTVKDLISTGDRVHKIRGVVSGTLTFLFSRLRAGVPFSAAVRDAIDRGYAEPDVRDDLSGEDVARKFLILARTSGQSVERSDVCLESLVPDRLEERSYEAFLAQLDTVNDPWKHRVRAAAADGKVLQYVGELSAGEIDVGVEEVPKDDALGQLGGQNNLVEITTDRYAESPLVVRGPGAGPDVTAASVLADVLKVADAVAGPCK